MSGQVKLDVTFPGDLEISPSMNRAFRTEVRTLMKQNGGKRLSGRCEDDGSYHMRGYFPSRDAAIKTVRRFRSLSLEHVKESAGSFSYLIDMDEMLLFSKDKQVSFESKSIAADVFERTGIDMHDLFDRVRALESVHGRRF